MATVGKNQHVAYFVDLGISSSLIAKLIIDKPKYTTVVEIAAALGVENKLWAIKIKPNRDCP